MLEIEFDMLAMIYWRVAYAFSDRGFFFYRVHSACWWLLYDIYWRVLLLSFHIGVIRLFHHIISYFRENGGWKLYGWLIGTLMDPFVWVMYFWNTWCRVGVWTGTSILFGLVGIFRDFRTRVRMNDILSEMSNVYPNAQTRKLQLK